MWSIINDDDDDGVDHSNNDDNNDNDNKNDNNNDDNVDDVLDQGESVENRPPDTCCTIRCVHQAYRR